MKEWLMNILQCPVCKSDRLKLRVAAKQEEEIVWGAILCEGCRRWFPIVNGIPHLLPDELRKGEDKEFVEHAANMIEGVVFQLRPPTYMEK